MTPRSHLAAQSTIRLPLPLLVVVPLVVAGAFAVVGALGLGSPPSETRTRERAARLEDWFERQTREALALTEAVLRDAAGGGTGGSRKKIAERLEGVGVLDREFNYLSWQGTPPEPTSEVRDVSAPAWQIRRDGVHTRLVVRAGPDDGGRFAVASFLVDSRLPDVSFARWVPGGLLSGVTLELTFAESATAAQPAPVDPPAAPLVLRSTDGLPLAHGSLLAVSAAHARSRIARIGVGCTLVALLAMVAATFAWRRWTSRFSGLLVALVVLLVGRLALARVGLEALVLPRELGAASLFGTSALWGLAASPAALLLTAIAFYLACLAKSRYARALGERRRLPGLWSVGAPILAALACVGVTLQAVARNTRVPLLDGPGFWDPGGRLVVLVALATMMLGCAELIAVAWRLARPGVPGTHGTRPTRVTVGLVLLPLTLVGSAWLDRVGEELALERLEAEYVPLVLEQRARRSLALSAALGDVERALARDGTGVRQDLLAYDSWVSSDLFFGGYKSSLEVFNAAGRRISSFGFDLPLFDEPVDVGVDAVDEAGRPLVRDEFFEPVAAVRKRLLHGEVVVRDDGRVLGQVVGHVLDEPDNLPFLPASQPYLAALGPAAPYGERAGPEYLLYDAPGTVVLSTLNRPPAMAEVLVQAFDRGGRVEVDDGDQRYVGRAVQDPYHRLHVLLVSARDPLERLASSVRMSLVGVAVLVGIALLPFLARPARLATLSRELRGSFYRKLLVALLLASMVPLIGMALFVRGFVQSRGQVTLADTATQFAGAAQRVLNDYAATQSDFANGAEEAPLNDEIVSWLRSVIGQEIHVYENGLLQATSKRELFTSGLLPPRLEGEVQRRLGREGLPYVVVPASLGPRQVPVAYAPVQSNDPLRALVVAVPVLGQERVIARGVNRVAEMILIATVALAGLLAVVAAYVARTVARPVRELVGATGRIAAGDYETRLDARTRDEVAELVRGFNSMAGSLASQRADLERRREYMERLLRHATTGVLSTDVEGRIVTLNPAARELLSSATHRPQIGERLVESLGRSAELEPLAETLRRDPRQRGEPDEVDLERNGEPRRLRLVRVDLPEPGGGSVGRLLLLDDVTDLMKSNQLAAWAEMARAIAHEIKNPLTPIQLSTEHLERLLRDRGLSPAPDLEACLETVKKQVRTLYDIAGEFSAYAKLPALAPAPADPVEFMRETIGPYRVAGIPGVELDEHYDASPPVAIDAKVLGRAVINLIENALQAMPDGGRLGVGVAPAAGGDGNVVLWVEDSGIGLDPEVRRRLFEPYFSTKSSGTGLGLAIVQRAVEAHQGRITVESAPGSGTRFRIVLPASVREPGSTGDHD